MGLIESTNIKICMCVVFLKDSSWIGLQIFYVWNNTRLRNKMGGGF